MHFVCKRDSQSGTVILETQKITALRFPLAKAVIIPLFAIWCSLGAVNLTGASNALSQILIFAAAYISVTSLATPIFPFPKTDC